MAAGLRALGGRCPQVTELGAGWLGAVGWYGNGNESALRGTRSRVELAWVLAQGDDGLIIAGTAMSSVSR